MTVGTGAVCENGKPATDKMVTFGAPMHLQTEPPTTENNLGRIPTLDGIRGVAISLVLWWHAMPGGLPNHPHLQWILKFGTFSWSGVDLFFVLSGFLIGGILLDAARSSSYFSAFYIRRAYRILPLYAVLLVLAVVVEMHYRWLPLYVFFVQNFWTAVTGSYGIAVLAVTWSLAVEEQFYLTLPLVIRYFPRRILWRVLAVAVVSAPLLRALAMHFLRGKARAAYVLMPCRADALCLGVLLAMASRSRSVWATIVARRNYVYTALSLATCTGLWLVMGNFNGFPTDSFGIEYSLLAMIYSLLLLSTLVSPWLSRLFSFPPLRFMGVIAYALYLFHQAIIFAFRKVALYLYSSRHGVPQSVADILAVVACVGFAAISWEYFEKPLVKRGHRHQY